MGRPRDPDWMAKQGGDAAGGSDPAPETTQEPQGVARVVDISQASPEHVAKLLAEIDGLREQLATEKAARSEAEERALAAAQAQSLVMQPGIEEVPTGKTVTVQRVERYKTVGYKDDGRPILKPVFKDVELPTFFYKIDMPPCGGTDMKINGTPLYHGATYEFDIDTLRSVKEIVHRVWRHDAEIHGSDENAYRAPQRPVLRAGA